jgi:arylsulfatase A-like enzyme
MRIPQMKGRNRLIRNPVSQIDMVPTVLDLMGSKADRNFPGQSLVPLIKESKVLEDHVFIEWNPGSGAVKLDKDSTIIASREELKRAQNEYSRAVISPDGWKLCLSDVDKCQLFDHKNDPGETTNLFDSGRHKDVINRLTKKIHRWQKEVADTARV